LDFIQKYPIFKINLLIKSLLPLFNNLKDSKKHKKNIQSLCSLDEIKLFFKERTFIWN